MATIAKRRDRWVIDFYDNQGKRRWKTMPKGSTKKNAMDELRGIEDQLKRGIYLPDKKIPLFKEVASDWIEYKRQNLRESTWGVYEGHVRNHFSELNQIRINRITTAILEKYISQRQQEGMNILTLRKVLVSLGQILSYAVRHKYIDHNPLRDAERPRSRGNDGDQFKIRILSPDEIQSLINATDSQKFRTLFMFAIMSGCRQGEILGLKWTDIDWINNQVHVQRTYNMGRWFQPKTKTSNRKVDLGPVMMKELKLWRIACLPTELDLVFPNEAGQPMDHNNFNSRCFRRALKTSGIGKMRFHHLRHTYASLLIEQGENLKYIQTQLGHSSPSVTLNVYAHLMKPVNPESACRLENTIFQTNGSKMVADNKKGLM